MKKKITLEQILLASIDLGIEKGLLNISLNEIAAQIGIKTPSLYNHIAGIDDLYTQLASQSLKALETHLTQSIIGFSGFEALTKVANAYFDFAQKNPLLYEAIENPRLKNTEEIAQLKENIVLLIQALLKSYHFSPEQEVSIIRVLRSYLHGFVSLNAGNLYNIKNVEVKDSFDLGLSALLNGLKLDRL